MANTTLTFNETTYEFVFNKAIHTNEDYREQHKIVINGKDTGKLLLVSTKKIDGVVVDNPQMQKYEILVPYNAPTYSDGVGYNTPFKQFYRPYLPFEIMASIVTFLNKSIEKESIENQIFIHRKKFEAFVEEELKK
jgi:hypothetical protein